MSFGDIAKLIINSETYYPIYYDHIVNSSYRKSQTPLTFILWLIFLPIPSIIWSGKPTLARCIHVLSLQACNMGIMDIHLVCPPVMGESLMYFVNLSIDPTSHPGL